MTLQAPPPNPHQVTSGDLLPVPVPPGLLPSPAARPAGPSAAEARRPGRPPLSRRQFLGLAGGLGAVGALGAALGPRAWDALFGGGTDSRGALAPAGGRRLVMVTLYGGNDGLNTVVPYEDPLYTAGREGLALDPATVLPLGEGYGLHPALTGFKTMWDQKKLAIVEGVGFADPNYSHFASMDIWQSGVTSSSEATGWLGRWLDATGSSPLRAVGIGPTTPVLLTGDRVQGAALPAGPLRLPGDATEEALYASLGGTTRREALLLAEAARSGAALLDVQHRLGPILDRTTSDDPLHFRHPSPASTDTDGALAIADGGGGLSGGSVLAAQLSMVANLILADAPTDVYSVELGGFDTHSDQAPTQARLLAEVDTAVTAFVDALAPDSRGRETVVAVYTEFGRRVTGNASGGSDHGWANVVFVAGAPVRGGWYGDPPSLGRLSDGNTVFTTDFRSVYATLFDQVLGVAPRSFLQGSFPPVAFL